MTREPNGVRLVGRVNAMSEISHLRCDRCDLDIIVDQRSLMSERASRDWARCMVGFDNYDFCPSCWHAMLTFAKTG